MILDLLSSFVFKKAYTTSPGYSTDDTSGGTSMAGYIDLGATDAFAKSSNTGVEYLGVGESLFLCVLVTTLLNDANTPRQGTVIATLETADDSAFTSNLTTIMTLDTIPAGSKAGVRSIGRLPYSKAYRRYIRVKFTFAVTLTAGKLSAFLVHDADLNTSYPSRELVD